MNTIIYAGNGAASRHVCADAMSRQFGLQFRIDTPDNTRDNSSSSAGCASQPSNA
ncbi:MAG TPA: hypothetical protein VGL08_19265 [Paraburkholderia sp.]